MTDSKTYYHNKGQEDAPKGRYKEPHGPIAELLSNRAIENNISYKEGYAQAKGQTDESGGKYDPPSNKNAKKVYDKSWQDSHENKKSQ